MKAEPRKTRTSRKNSRWPTFLKVLIDVLSGLTGSLHFLLLHSHSQKCPNLSITVWFSRLDKTAACRQRGVHWRTPTITWNSPNRTTFSPSPRAYSAFPMMQLVCVVVVKTWGLRAKDSRPRSVELLGMEGACSESHTACCFWLMLPKLVFNTGQSGVLEALLSCTTLRWSLASIVSRRQRL